MQQAIDMRKRLKGPPVGGGQATIVVTDIQGQLSGEAVHFSVLSMAVCG